MKTFVYYHKNCFDGMAAAWAVRHFLLRMGLYDTAEFIPVQYGDNKIQTNLLQDCYENANINDRYIIVDFSFPRDLMMLMASKAKSMLVLDHHKTAEEACQGLDFCKFNMEQSGAGLAWRYFFPSEPVPKFIEYIEDRDLWRFALPYSKDINAYIQSFDMNMDNYESIYIMLESYSGFNIAREAGVAIERYKMSMVEAICRNAVIKGISSHRVPVINATLLFSEIGHRLCEMYPEHPFAASFFIRQDGKMQYSLRSIGDFDVSAVAKEFGGGGHKNAAGFEVPLFQIDMGAKV